ncbi:DNA polymerase III subunit beta [Thermobispora bispora]|uniref:Beta sliding clamp n=1 Tax=Thermobispora bispora (strain ATCC 19993 / DSM 43833 / CBS 139.67 / JCM 10125 / KCTC 9307 / NBRC 14880 / R51) TaxID=469371 RepID=D6Y204_THEBD|nr:DNA polymerase III subunit beta [Thermobispora bispora]ADG86739.1 DNA polymerase III, beta subunit [Thermobispora bispora DSM 43833]MDI9579102.1 DNA polymerase III subunit beta [Thermobispora sp.]QSI46710.1 DNA polymerase III subunit beta [Thermobispora bispora]
MLFRIDRDQLAEAVAWTARSLPTRPSMPVLAGMRLEVTDDHRLKLSGFDYEVSAEVTLDLETGEPGVVLVSGRLLAEITRALPAQPVNFTLDGAKAVVTCGSTRFTLLTMPVEDYPSLPVMPPAAGRVGSDVFASAVAQVAVAVGKDDTLPMLTGVRMEIEGDLITLAATDRYRLAVRELKWEPAQPGLQAVAMIPGRTLADIAKALGGTGAEVEIALSSGGTGEGMIGFSSAGRRTTTRLLDPEFPKYRSLLPTEFSARADVATSAFVEAVKRVALVAERNTPVRLTFRGGEVVLEAGSGDEAQAVEVLPVDFEGDEITIAFNHQYLLDGLAVLDSDVARMQFTTPTKPAIITAGKPAGEEAASDYRYLIMPIRLSS